MLYFIEIICLCADIRKIINNHNQSITYKKIIYEHIDTDLLNENSGLLISKKLASSDLISSFTKECYILYDEYIIHISWIYENDNNYYNTITFDITIY